MVRRENQVSQEQENLRKAIALTPQRREMGQSSSADH